MLLCKYNVWQSYLVFSYYCCITKHSKIITFKKTKLMDSVCLHCIERIARTTHNCPLPEASAERCKSRGDLNTSGWNYLKVSDGPPWLFAGTSAEVDQNMSHNLLMRPEFPHSKVPLRRSLYHGSGLQR